MSLRVGLSLVAAAALSLPLAAQTRPNLSGTWQLIPEKTTPARPAPAPPAPPTTISLDANTITISSVAYSGGAGRVTMDGTTGRVTSVQTTPQAREEFRFVQTYVCDGSEHPEPARVPPLPSAPASTPPPGATSMSTDQTYTATWSRDQLVITTRAVSRVNPPSSSFVPRTRVTRKTYSIDSEGQLVIETLTTSEPAPNETAQPAPVPVRSFYRKIS